MMDFLRRLFGGGSPASGDRGMYVYVRPKMCKEVLRLRIDPMNNLSESDEGGTFFLRKMATGQRCLFPVEITVYFDASKRITNREITNGEFVTEEEYTAFVETSQTPVTPA